MSAQDCTKVQPVTLPTSFNMRTSFGYLIDVCILYFRQGFHLIFDKIHYFMIISTFIYTILHEKTQQWLLMRPTNSVREAISLTTGRG